MKEINFCVIFVIFLLRKKIRFNLKSLFDKTFVIPEINSSSDIFESLLYFIFEQKNENKIIHLVNNLF